MSRRDPQSATDDYRTDGRINDEYVRRIPPDESETGGLALVGVAHDHPASVRRVRALAAATDPDVVAVEMPPLAVPLLRRRAADGRGCDDLGKRAGGGDEMSAAVAAAPDARVVGVDGIDGQFLAALAGALREEGADAGTVRRVAGRTARIAVRTGACWLRGAFGLGDADGGPRSGATYDCPADDPLAQADHEREHVRQCATLLAAVDQPPRARAIDAARESCMARRIAGLRGEGSVLAVVGWAHLEAVAEGLAPPTGAD